MFAVSRFSLRSAVVDLPPSAACRPPSSSGDLAPPGACSALGVSLGGQERHRLDDVEPAGAERLARDEIGMGDKLSPPLRA
jgi:hypothetical protein